MNGSTYRSSNHLSKPSKNWPKNTSEDYRTNHSHPVQPNNCRLLSQATSYSRTCGNRVKICDFSKYNWPTFTPPSCRKLTSSAAGSSTRSAAHGSKSTKIPYRKDSLSKAATDCLILVLAIISIYSLLAWSPAPKEKTKNLQRISYSLLCAHCRRLNICLILRHASQRTSSWLMDQPWSSGNEVKDREWEGRG